MTLPAAFYGRKAALAAAAGVIALCAALIALLAFAVYDIQRSAEADDLHQLALYRAEIAARPVVSAAADRVRAQITTMSALIHGAGGAPAAAILQSTIKTLVSANGGQVRSAQVLPSTIAGGFEIVAVQYDLTVPMNKLSALSYAVETSLPWFFIDGVDITAPVNWDPKSPTSPTLEVRWTVRGYRRVDER